MSSRARTSTFGVLLVFLLGGCANPPHFVKRTRALRFLYRPATTPYLDDPRFSFELPRKWRQLDPIPGGARFLEPKGRASLSIAFFSPKDEGYKSPDVFRQYMREQGTVNDSHILYRLEVSTRTADAVRFTSFQYSPEYLLGERFDVMETEIALISEPHGIYVLRYEAEKREFPRHRHAFELFLKSLILAQPRQAYDWE